MDIITPITVAAGLGWASGLRLYAVLFFIGVLGYFGLIDVPPDLAILSHPMVMLTTGALFAFEFGADKIPGFDSVWDSFQTFVRIPGGALLAAAAVADHNAALALAAGLLGGTFAAGAHFAKAGSRVLINTSPEPFSNWAVSLAEDTLAAGMVWFAFSHPLALLFILIVVVLLTIWLLPKLWRGVRRVINTARQLLGLAV
ncbi:MAG: DUF4126 domain-containing protein [Betaproteobacteria bacterium]